MRKAIHKYLAGESYPPEDHILRDLAIAVETEDTSQAVISAPVSIYVCAQNGVLYAGVLATLTDVVGGILAVRAIMPDWLSTAHMSLMTTRNIRSGHVSGHGRLIRCGRTSVVVGVDVYNETERSAGTPEPAGMAMITYSRLSGNGKTLPQRSDGHGHHATCFSLGITPLAQALVEKAGIEIIDSAGGRLRINMTPYVRNSLNSLQGGVIAFLADLAGPLALSADHGNSWQTRDLTIHYMTPGIKGPFETAAVTIRSDSHNALMRIEVLDRGDENRLMAVIFNACIRVGS